ISDLSFPSSAWECRSAKLRFAREVAAWTAKQSFAAVRSQAELGNEGMGAPRHSRGFCGRGIVSGAPSSSFSSRNAFFLADSTDTSVRDFSSRACSGLMFQKTPVYLPALA